MIDLLLIIILFVVLLGLITYLITSIRDNKAEEMALNHETYNQFRTACLQMILRSISTGFCVSVQDMSVEQSQSDWHFNWTSVIFDNWIIWFTLNWNTKVCKITCMYERDDHEMLIKKFSMRIVHNTIDEAKLIQRLEKINTCGYKFALPTQNAKATAAIKDAYSLASELEIPDEELFNIMYSAWTRLPYRTKKEAEDFIRITAFLFRHHLEEMKKKSQQEIQKEDR